MDAHQILIKTRELLSDPARWTQNAFARLPTGERVNALAEGASCWCLLGATTRVVADDNDLRWTFHPTNALREARRAIAPDQDIPAFNDAKTTKHEDVLAALDSAIERTKPS